ncbi:hypothetical protein [Prochlorococcus marinus]|uniref:hypothetical protein n=1 Tax=Prochlorococcus marinus TaxID=1219 RepID=UPI0022B50B9E|nr:hypothetical protein [Prochlorococcus marinus]
MTNTEENNQKKDSSKLKKKKTDLPWWVEILFVQIGLPEKLLVNFLIYKDLVNKNIKNKFPHIQFTLFLIITVIYINPIIKNYRYKNICIEEALRSTKSIDNKQTTHINSLNICNGGKL